MSIEENLSELVQLLPFLDCCLTEVYRHESILTFLKDRLSTHWDHLLGPANLIKHLKACLTHHDPRVQSIAIRLWGFVFKKAKNQPKVELEMSIFLDYILHHGTSIEFEESIDFGCIVALNDALESTMIQNILSHPKLPSILIKGFTHPSLATVKASSQLLVHLLSLSPELIQKPSFQEFLQLCAYCLDENAEMNDQIAIVELAWALLHTNEKGWSIIQELNLIPLFVKLMIHSNTHKVIQHRLYEILKFISENESQRFFLFPSNDSFDSYLQLLCSALNEKIHWELLELIYVDLMKRKLLDPAEWLNEVLEALKGNQTHIPGSRLISESSLHHFILSMESMQPFLQMILVVLQENILKEQSLKPLAIHLFPLRKQFNSTVALLDAYYSILIFIQEKVNVLDKEMAKEWVNRLLTETLSPILFKVYQFVLEHLNEMNLEQLMQVFEHYCQKSEHESEFLFIGLRQLQSKNTVPNALSRLLLLIKQSNIPITNPERMPQRNTIPQENSNPLFDLTILKMHDKCHLGCYDC